MVAQAVAKQVEVEEPVAVVDVEEPEAKTLDCSEHAAEVTGIIVESGIACIGERRHYYVCRLAVVDPLALSGG